MAKKVDHMVELEHYISCMTSLGRTSMQSGLGAGDELLHLCEELGCSPQRYAQIYHSLFVFSLMDQNVHRRHLS